MSTQVALPIELERPIFELAAQEDRKNAQSLACVAKRVKDWIDPIFFSRVYLLDSAESYERRTAGPSSLTRFMSVFRSQSAQFLAENVHHLCLCSSTSFELSEVQSILRVCTNIATLSYGGSVPSWNHALTLLHSKKLTRLSMELPSSPPTDAQKVLLKPLLENITHLDVLSVWPHPSTIELLPSLTHLALDFEDRVDAHLSFLPCLSANTHIECVAFVMQSRDDVEGSTLEAYTRLQDSRFTPVLFLLDRVREEWFASTYGKKDMWSRAEENIRRRKRNIRTSSLPSQILASSGSSQSGVQLEELGASIRLCRVSRQEKC